MKDDFVDNIKIEDEPKNFYFQKAGKIYKITIFLLTDNISLIISETNKFSQIYGIKLNLKQIKAKHISFSKLLSLQEFIKIVKDNNEQKAINITKKSEYIIRFELTKYSVYFGLTKKEISNDKILENINIIKEKYEQKLSESNKTKKLIQEIDEIKKTNKILIEENEKLKEIIFLEEKNKKEANNKDKEILELKQELEEIKNFIEKFKNNEVEPIWAKTISFKEKFEKKNKLDITCKEINNIISKNNNYYKINIFEQKQNYIDKQEVKNNKNKIGNDFHGKAKEKKRNLSERKFENNFLENISEEYDKNNPIQERIQTDYNIKEEENNKCYCKVLTNKKTPKEKTAKNKSPERKNYNTNTNYSTRNNSIKFITPTKANNTSSNSEEKSTYI